MGNGDIPQSAIVCGLIETAISQSVSKFLSRFARQESGESEEDSGKFRGLCSHRFCVDICSEFEPCKLSLSVLPGEREWTTQYGESIFCSSRAFNLGMKGLYLSVMLYAQYVSTLNWGPNLKFYGIYLTY